MITDPDAFKWLTDLFTGKAVVPLSIAFEYFVIY
jgi:hypothetical protein